MMDKSQYLELLIEKLPKPINNDFIQNLEQKTTSKPNTETKYKYLTKNYFLIFFGEKGLGHVSYWTSYYLI